ncbi:MAG: GNAT family N-acetyltransferase [Tepidisphaera sp.]|nr:GNAT family N-acetyltransferase [Tepidisphaera sp.]
MSSLAFPHLLRTPITIAPGSWADYARLAGHHYRLGHPRTFDAVLAAMHGSRVVGVLVASRPVLNATWRSAAWGDRYAAPTPKRDIAQRLNAEVRVISRVIVEPRYRGLGVARRLVEAYLAHPLTRRTEALAGMGRWCPFFERAGMRRVECEPPRRDEALARVIAAAGFKPWMLADLSVASRLLARNPRVRLGLEKWANASRASRTRPICAQLLVLAASSIASPPVAYVAEAPSRKSLRARSASEGLRGVGAPTPPELAHR